MRPGSSRPPGGLLRANVGVALGTATSRVTGFLRLMALAAAIGQLGLADAYNTANNTPNIVYELLLGGVFSAALVPFFVARYDDGDDEAISVVSTVSVVALLAVTVTATAAAPWIIRLYTVAAKSDVSTLRSVGTTLARFFLPQIFFYGVAGLATALLNARKRFVAAAFAPAVNNVIAIIAFVALPHLVHGHRDLARASHSAMLVRVLGIGTTLGVIASAVVLLPALRPAGVDVSWRFAPGHEAVRELLRRTGWVAGYVAANQVAVAVVTALAQRRSGEVSAYFNAFTIFALPHGLLAASIITTFTPDLARAAHRGQRQAVAARISLGVRALALLVLPTSILLMVLARPVIGVTLQHGAFTAASAVITAKVLIGLAAGLFAFSTYLFLLRGFYAYGDTKTPFILNALENGVNIVLAVALSAHWGVAGLAWSFSIAYVVAALLTFGLLTVRLGGIGDRDFWLMLGQVGAAALVMAGVTHELTNHVDGWLARTSAGLVVGPLSFIATYAVLRLPRTSR